MTYIVWYHAAYEFRNELCECEIYYIELKENESI